MYPSRFRDSDSNWKMKRPGERGVLGLVLGLALEDQEGLFHREPARGDLGLADDVGLEGREVVADPRHRRRHQAGSLDLGVQERDGQGQLGGREQLLADP